MAHDPIFADLRDKRCVVVGGGIVAQRKTAGLLRAGADVTVVAPELTEELSRLRDDGRLRHLALRFRPEHLDGAWLVIATTDDSTVNQEVATAAGERRVFANVVDNLPLCSFTAPAVVDRAPLQIAISTGGASPILARLLKSRLETLIPASYGRLAALMGLFRERVRQRISDFGARRRFWEDVLQGPIAELVLARREDEAIAALDATLDKPPPIAVDKTIGEIYLVGAGPGDPDLVTFRALRLMQQTDVVLHDRLVAPAILDLVRKDAERIYVGKQESDHTLPQEEINALLVRLAREGKRVLRLKGGDPFIFGRGGEEIDTLAAAGIPFQVVPGITAASGCAAYAGIPLTHRDFAQSCLFVTGHLKNNTMDLDWPALARPNQTVVVYMGLRGIDILCQQLIAHGLPPTWPIALVEQGTTPNQRVLTSTLADLPTRVASDTVKPPSLLIIGEVVRLHEQLAWFNPTNHHN